MLAEKAAANLFACRMGLSITRVFYRWNEWYQQKNGKSTMIKKAA